MAAARRRVAGSFLLLCLLAASLSAGRATVAAATAERECDGEGAAAAPGQIRAEAAMTDEGAAAKGKWPELVGKSKEQAEAVLLAEAPGATLQFLPEDAMVTMDFREDRIRVFSDDSGTVVRAPMRG